jgi:hypothetical protein
MMQGAGSVQHFARSAPVNLASAIDLAQCQGIEEQNLLQSRCQTGGENHNLSFHLGTTGWPTDSFSDASQKRPSDASVKRR